VAWKRHGPSASSPRVSSRGGQRGAGDGRAATWAYCELAALLEQGRPEGMEGRRESTASLSGGVRVGRAGDGVGRA
jgi:hypothetical protein